MAAGDLVTRPGHIQYGPLLLGPGTPYRWKELTGWEELPAIDSGTVARSDAHGAFPGRLLAQARTIGLDGLMVRAPRDRIGAVVGALSAGTAIVEDEQPLVVWIDERGPLLSYARAVRRIVPTGIGYRTGSIQGGAVQWEATDPRRYALAEQVATARLPASERGLDWRVPDAAARQFPDAAAAGLGPLDGWYAEGGTLSLDADDRVMFEVAEGGALIVWPLPIPTGYSVPEGGTAEWVARDLSAGAQLQLHWIDAAGVFLSATSAPVGAAVVEGVAPAGAVGVRPVMTWPQVPPGGPVWVGRSVLYVPAPGASGLAWPLEFGTPGSTGALSVTNAGDAPAHPVIEFRGPVERPSLTKTGTGETLEYDLPLAAGDVLTVDTGAGTVLLNQTASRLGAASTRSVPEQTFTLAPGELVGGALVPTTTPLIFRAAPGSTDPAASVTVRWRSAYW